MKHKIWRNILLLSQRFSFVDKKNRSSFGVFLALLLVFGLFTTPLVAYGASSEKINTSKNVRIGQPLTLLLYDSNLNRDSDKAETYSLDLIRFESDKVKTTLGPKGGVQDAFDPRPSALRETGDNTGVFYSVIEIPRILKGQRIDLGEKIEFEYTQRGLGAFLVLRQGEFSTDKADVPKNPSKVSMKAKSFRFGQPVEVTVNDPDLNLNGDLIDVYRVVNNPSSPFVDTVGSSGGILLEIKIKDIRYKRCTINGVFQGGLAATGFTLIETDPSSGVFKGVFKVPSKICDKSGTKLISSAGGSIKLIYHDFRDSFGQRNIQSTR